ncbi:uncharacterized protein LOC114542821 [Dendronephthya gigantea]|uniref:uncharacterized protein LOC114542821 n=1 Tax=Dendronephthya gigantea TaxID=151771 RepID=UPI00106CEAEA|nr:uncharacterized protein LOC114542821 [Dendronephthya gigantea]
MFAMAYGSEVDIQDMDNITALMEQTIECISEVHPEFMQKQKFHMLLHLQDDMRNYGPPIGFCTERFEAFNSIIRQLNIFSYRQASSKDIGEKFAKRHQLKFLISGGYWKNGSNRRCASKELIQITQQPAFQKFMYQVEPKASGLMHKEIYQPGSLRLGNCKNGKMRIVTVDILPTTQVTVQEDINMQNVNLQPKCKEFKACVAQDKSLIHKGDVFAYYNRNNEACFGKFCTSVQFSLDGVTENWVLLAEFKKKIDDNGNIVYGKFRSPLLEETETKRLIPSTALLEKVSVVHNCDYQCGFVDAEMPVVEEREVTNKDKHIFEHDQSNKVHMLMFPPSNNVASLTGRHSH